MTPCAPQFDRQIFVFVRDADHHLVEGAVIKWIVDGKHFGTIHDSDGRGTLVLKDQTLKVEVTVEYQGRSANRLLALQQHDCTIVFPDLHLHPDTWMKAMQQHFPAVIGIFFVLIAVALAFTFSNPTAFQTHVLLAVLSLGGGAFGSEITGMLQVNLTLGQKFVIGATGAAAIFVILYFAVPAS